MNSRSLSTLRLVSLAILAALMVGCAPALGPMQEEFEAAATEEPESDVLNLIAEGGSEVETEASGDDGEIPAQQQERMIIKNGDLSLLVEDADSAVGRVTQVATDHGGYVLSTETWLSGGSKHATVSIAVRSDQFEAAMERLRGIAVEVLSESASGQDVTGEYVDLESRLRTLEATRERIQAFLDQAQTVEEALDVNRELTSIDAEIEQVRGRMKYLSGRAAFSTITVQLQVDPPVVQAAAFSPSETIQQAMLTQAALFQGLIQVLIWLIIVPGPYLLVIGLVFFGARWWMKRRSP